MTKASQLFPYGCSLKLTNEGANPIDMSETFCRVNMQVAGCISLTVVPEILVGWLTFHNVLYFSLICATSFLKLWIPGICFWDLTGVTQPACLLSDFLATTIRHSRPKGPKLKRPLSSETLCTGLPFSTPWQMCRGKGEVVFDRASCLLHQPPPPSLCILQSFQLQHGQPFSTVGWMCRGEGRHRSSHPCVTLGMGGTGWPPKCMCLGGWRILIWH